MNRALPRAAPARPLSYALITPARNEEAFIERTLESVIAQTVRPIRWVIVSDGSTDRTDQIVQGYAERHAWIELLHLSGPPGRNFARKARAFNAGRERLAHLSYDIVGNVDADVSFDDGLFAFLLERFAAMPELGIAGPPYRDDGVRSVDRFANINYVAGCCQLFRRACLDDLGGYVAVERGGIDWIAVTTARMKGWKTRTFVEKECVHHRDTRSAGRVLEMWFRRGEKDYALGGHPLWQVARSIYRSATRPYVLGGMMLLAGYTYQLAKRGERPVSRQLIAFHRAEQMQRLRHAAVSLLPFAHGARAQTVGELSIDDSFVRLERWVEAHEYRGYEPFDGLSSYLRRLTFGSRLLEQIVQQVGRQSPINVRPLLGIHPIESANARGYMAWGYLAALRRTGREHYRQRAVACLEWLMRNKSPRYADYSWGNGFDYASRAGRYPAHESTIVWTSLIGQAFLDGFETLGDARYLDVATSISRWIMQLPRQRTSSGACLSYVAIRQTSVHNANLLGAAMLARTAKHAGCNALLDVARDAVQYSCARQRADGAWFYGEEPTYRWIDSFHTAYNLDSIKCYIDSSGDEAFQPHLDRGFRYFTTTFFEPDGRPRYYDVATYPIDIQCAAQGIETLAKFGAGDPAALSTAETVARWTIRHMQDATGYFYYRRYPFAVARIPMLHWGQATMYRALALLLLQMERGTVGVSAQ